MELPAVEVSGWIAQAVGEINAYVGRTFGLQVTVLRHLHEAEFHVVLLEVHCGVDWLQGRGCWKTWESVARASGQAGLGGVLQGYFGSGTTPSGPIPWERAGWFGEACEWVGEILAAIGRRQTGPIEQRKAAWGWSSILRVPTSQGSLYFKAEYSAPPSEGAVIELLARRFPQQVPRLLACDRRRGWILMEDFGGVLLPDSIPERFSEAVRCSAAMQLQSASALAAWKNLGTAAVDVALLHRHSRVLARHAGAGGLYGASDLARFTKIVEQALAVVGAAVVPLSVVNQDFRPNNVAVGPSGELVFFDWGNVVIAHPFFSFSMFLRYCRHFSRQSRGALMEDYLRIWLCHGELEELKKELRAVAILEPIFVSLWEYRELERGDVQTPWGAHLAQGILSRRGGQDSDPIAQVLQADLGQRAV